MIQQVEIFDLLQKRLWRQPIRLIELFGGIGSQHKALTRLGVEVNEHYLVEIDADATISYAAIHCDLHSHLNDEVPSKEKMIAYLQPLNWWKNEKPLNLERYGKLKELYLAQRLTNNLGDLNQLDDLPQADMITWSTPCQDFSNAGLKAGFTGKKGSLTHATVELFQKMSYKPTFLLFENVPMIISKTFRDGFDDVFRQIADLGYENILMKLNAKHYGIPQNRDRVFVLSIRKGYDANYSKPKPIDLKLRLKDMLEDEVDASFYLSDKMMAYMVGSSSSGAFDRSKVFKPHDENSKYANTITTYANDRPTDNFVIIPEDNQKGYAEAYKGDGVYIDRPHQKRGTVQKGMIQTLSTTPHTDVGVVVAGQFQPKHRDYNKNGFDRQEQFETRSDEVSNTVMTNENKNMIGVVVTNINQKVSVRKHEVDTDGLQRLLKKHKNISNKKIAELINEPITLVEHWFRTDNSFSIPLPKHWNRLKKILDIQTDQYDESIMTFVEKDNVFEKSNRVYDEVGIAPTITSTSADEKIIVGTTQCINSKVNGKQPKVQDRIYDEQGISTAVTTSFMPSVLNQLQIRKLTPRETWRLMGFDDSDFDKASAIHSNSTLYKQAGNSIVVNVLEHILKGLFYESTTI
jgi:DNA-cytosine methyltransferase